ncbi:MAG: YibE/F family protein, partial [Acidimicrobiia bacterium]|nr:YibE/F family protein [Acidimicrobiia bacterium]
LGALGLTLVIATVFFDALRFTGLATEEGLTLPLIAEGIDLTGLLLGGAIIGALGALDDVTVTQVATVGELAERNPELGRRELVASGVRVGREHIASTVNTLLLAYVGASMPLLLLFAVSDQSLSTVANSELIAVEIARTLCGSIGLVAAVPLTTVLAAMVVGGDRTANPEDAADIAADPEPATVPDEPDRDPERAVGDGSAAAVEPEQHGEDEESRGAEWTQFAPPDDADWG